MTGKSVRKSEMNRRGISLLELVLVAAIISVLALLAAPRFAHSIVNQRVLAASRRIVIDLAMAQDRAKSLSADQSVVFDTVSNSYKISGVKKLDNSSGEYSVDFASEPYKSELVSVDFGGDSTIVFNGYGMPDSGGTIVVQIGQTTRTIMLDADTGKASIQ